MTAMNKRLPAIVLTATMVGLASVTSATPASAHVRCGLGSHSHYNPLGNGLSQLFTYQSPVRLVQRPLGYSGKWVWKQGNIFTRENRTHTRWC